MRWQAAQPVHCVRTVAHKPAESAKTCTVGEMDLDACMRIAEDGYVDLFRNC